MSIIFTPAAILEILTQIDELSQYDIGVTETLDGNIQIQIGNSTYELNVDSAEEVEVSEETIDTVESVNEDTYEDLVSEEEFEVSQDVVESGLIKEAIKSMLLGGAVKLIKRLL